MALASLDIDTTAAALCRTLRETGMPVSSQEAAIPESNIKVIVVGSGDALGSSGRAQSCYVIDDAIGRFALDFGMTSVAALQRLDIDPDTIGLVLISHLHGDHFGGVPLLLLHRAFGARSRTPLTIAGPPRLEIRLKTLVEELYPKAWGAGWNFPLDIVEIAPGREHEISGRRLITHPVRHFAGDAPSTALRVTTGGKTIAYSGDTGWTDTLVDVARDADLFICECNFFGKTAFDGHLSYEELLSRKPAFECKRMILTHLGPDMVGRVNDLDLEAAHDGMVIAL